MGQLSTQIDSARLGYWCSMGFDLAPSHTCSLLLQTARRTFLQPRQAEADRWGRSLYPAGTEQLQHIQYQLQ